MSKWEIARKQAIKKYEENYGSWEDADKYEREDFVFLSAGEETRFFKAEMNARCQI